MEKAEAPPTASVARATDSFMVRVVCFKYMIDDYGMSSKTTTSGCIDDGAVKKRFRRL